MTPQEVCESAIKEIESGATDTTETEEESRQNGKDTNAIDELIGLSMDLPVAKYGGPWHEGELLAMRKVLTGGRNKFPKKALPYIELVRKYLFQTSQLVAMAAAAHYHATQKAQEENQLVKPATFSDIGKLEAEKLRKG